MSTSVWPPISEEERIKAESDNLAKELAWLLDYLQETLESFKDGLEECRRLLTPTEPGSTLAMSSVRSEIVKGYISRVGTEVVKGSLVLRLRHIPPKHIAINHTHPLPLPPLASLRDLLNQSLDCIDITRWTGDKTSASYISGQLRLLHSLLQEAHETLRGPSSLEPDRHETWLHPVASSHFDPPLPENLSFDFSIQDASIVLVIRTLENADHPPDLRSRFMNILGGHRTEHDESHRRFKYGANGEPGGGREVRVVEKVRVEAPDPSLMAAMAKLGGLEHAVGMARACLGVVMEEDVEDLEDCH